MPEYLNTQIFPLLAFSKIYMSTYTRFITHVLHPASNKKNSMFKSLCEVRTVFGWKDVLKKKNENTILAVKIHDIT